MLALNIKPGDLLRKISPTPNRQKQAPRQAPRIFFHRMFFGGIFNIRHAKERHTRKKNIVQKIKNTKYLTDFQVTFYELRLEQE